MASLLLDDIQYKIEETRFGTRKRYLNPTAARFKEFRSHVAFFGLLLLHFTLGVCPEAGRRRVARGVIAIGRFAVGILALGQASLGVIALGQAGIGLLALAQASLGISAIGQLAVALRFALGQFAIGYIAIGQFGYGHFVLATSWLRYLCLESETGRPVVGGVLSIAVSRGESASRLGLTTRAFICREDLQSE